MGMSSKEKNRQPSSVGGKATKAPVENSKHSPRIQNRRAHFDYAFVDKIEAGIQLVGSEVKSARQGKIQLAQSFARIRGSEVFLLGCHIEEYIEANQLNHDPTRTRRLLLHKREIRKLTQRMQKQPGSTLIPLEVYFKHGYAKVLLGLGIGKAKYDKRAAIKEREDQRNIQKALRRR